MPTFKLDGRDIPFEPGDTIIRAAWRAGVEIPHYCWHPGLSVAANCRMCLVEIKSERQMMMPILRWDESKQDYVDAAKPKLMPACQQPAVDGQEVFAQTANVKQAQASVQEFLLLNHPVDCPICDQAGECKLQDYWLEHQATLKRKHTEPVHKPKAVRFGPTIVYDAERCIMCTRCIRVCDELVGDHVLDMRERGNKNEIVLSPGRQLDHDYTLMTEHVCPVGALTSRDFRFKARVWFLRSTPSVCSGCATGCNMHVDYDPRDQKVYRLRPRDNMNVNRFWMCDDGMLSYHRFNEKRATDGVVRQRSTGNGNGHVAPTNDVEQHLSPDQALALAVEALRGQDGLRLGLVLSAQHSTEDNAALVRLGKALSVEKFYLAALGGWKGDAILRNADNNPNRAGAIAALGREPMTEAQLLKDCDRGILDGVIVLGWAATSTPESLAVLRRLKFAIALSSNESALTDVCSHLLPVTAHVECDGSFINAKGATQRFKRAVKASPGVLPAWDVVRSLAEHLGHNLGFASLSELTAPSAPSTLPKAASPSTEARV